jgi:hypothetical protein
MPFLDRLDSDRVRHDLRDDHLPYPNRFRSEEDRFKGILIDYCDGQQCAHQSALYVDPIATLLLDCEEINGSRSEESSPSSRRR